MKYGARNQILAVVREIKKGNVMGQVKVDIEDPSSVTSVMTVDSIEDLGLKEGDRVKVVVKAIHVLLVKED
ncbi:MAG TPA: TOBE domain-containing protein [Thermoanaerobaculia bacterium]|nr:TOBE domain-containing protein [Thermoanaerobaculia bacterium]HUM29100.1 TOBE domain-containing protein [Thermoanaerobaculia bacterium]HXK67477.1 TOBE domain-containing protein [Thermoanaerobaculia bacterium]